MRILIAFPAFLILFLCSCQKEVDFANRNSNGNGNGGTKPITLLVKSVTKTGSDSLVTDYTYDANRKLIKMKIKGVDVGTPEDKEYQYFRNSSGILTKYSVIDPDLVAAGIDSLTTIVNYSTSLSKYTGYVVKLIVPGFILLDSAVYVYDGSGKIIEEDLYESPSGSGLDYYFTGKANYSYSNGNVSELDIHDFDQSGAETFTATTKVTYDSKTNPLLFGNEGFPMGHAEWVSVNNFSMEELSDSNGIADSQTVSYTYTYNSDNKPGTSLIAVAPDNIILNSNFYYH